MRFAVRRSRIAVATAVTLGACLCAFAGSAAAQTGGAGAPADPAATPTGPPGRATLLANGQALAPSNAPPQVVSAIAAANAIATYPYIYGGGHRSFISNGYDCSGAVSYMLHGGGLLTSPLPSGPMMKYGAARPRHLDQRLRQPQPRLRGGCRPALGHLGGRREAQPRQRPPLAREQAARRGATSSATTRASSTRISVR